MNKLSTMINLVITTSVIGCASTPINENCIVLSTNKIADKNLAPSNGTGIGLGTGVITGGIIGGISGVVIGTAVLTGAVAATPPVGVLISPFIFMDIFLYGTGGMIIGGIAGGLIGGAGGYAYDYNHAYPTYSYSLACGTSKDSYKIESGNVIFATESSIIQTTVTQADKTPIAAKTPVSLYNNDNKYFIKKNIVESENFNHQK